MRQMRVSDGSVVWDDFGGMPVASLPAKFRMPDIERYTGIGCPRLHLRLYSTVMRAHGLDEPQMITLFPLSLSGAAQRWFASLESSRRRTWDDLAQEFLRQFSFNTVVDVSRRELEALRQRTEESVSSFISRWRGKIAEIVDRPSERDQIQMVLRSLQPRIARHVVGVPFTDFGSLVMALYDVEDGITRGLWADSSPSDVKGKKPFIGPRPTEATGTSSGLRSDTHAQTLVLPSYATQGIERPAVSYTATGQPCYAAQFTARPAAPYPRPGAQQTSAPFALRTQSSFADRHAVEPGSSEAYEAGLLTALTPRPLPQPIPAQFRMDLHCAYHQGPGHETDRCTALRHAIQDLIDQGLVHLGQPSVTTNPLPTHTTHAVPPPAGGIHFLDFDETDDHVHMLSWDDPDPEPIMPAGIYETSGVTLEPQMPAPFRLAPYILIPDVEEVRAPHVDISQTPDVQYILRRESSETATSAAARPVEGTASQEEVRAEDDEILRQLQSTQARISIWSLLASSSTHRDALTRALSQIRVDTTTTPEGLIHMMTAGRATCIVFSDDDLPPEGSDHTRPLYISVGCSGRRVPSVLLDNGSALNVCPLATAIALGYAPSDFGPSTQTVRAYDSTRGGHGYIGDRVADRAGAIPSSLHQKVKFIHDGQVVVVQSVGDMFIAAEPVLEISHTDDDLFLTGFTFDEVQTVEIEDFCRDFVAMSFDRMGAQWCSILCGACPIYPAWGWVDVSMDRAMDGAAPHDEYIDEMLALSLSQIEETIQPGLASSFDLFGVFVIELAEESLTAPALESVEDLIVFDDLIDSHVGIVEGASDFVDPPLSFDETQRLLILAADQPRELRIGSDLSTDERDSLIQLLRAYLDVFAWSYEDMPGLDPSIVQHRERGDSEATQCGISISGRVPEWLANVVPVPKKDGKVRVCVDFRDLNKASPKDDFPLPHIDMLVDSTAGHSMLSFMDGFSGYSQILMAPEDMEKTSFITEWGTYCYRVMPFGLKNAGATYQRAATTLFHDMMHRDVEVYVDDMIVKSRGRSDHLAALERFFERIRQFRLRLNPKKCTFGVTSGKLLGYMVSERGIEVDPDKIRAILTCLPRTEREVRGFLGRLHVSALERIESTCCRLQFWRSYTRPSSTPILVSSDVALGCMLAQLDDSGKDRAIYYLSKRMLDYETRYVMIERYCLALKSIRGSIVADHLASLPVSDARAIDDDFPDEDVAAVTSLSGWRISVRLAFSDRHPATNNIVEYEACILATGRGFEDLRYTHLPRAQNQFADALATLASMIDIPADATVRPLIESRSAPAYCCLIDDMEIDDGLPWYHDIYHFLRLGVYPEAATAKDRRALRQLATRFVICGETLYRRSLMGYCYYVWSASADRVMREVHAGVCGPHMGAYVGP
ncbi:Transposon Ty3-I Gag-Pol polyprotein [Vitis vinifera]|uniref:Transposon Ty3-I Gag-Pol polyprotein n=1 Tax=Vitis vinifera TaxID=29760 RepID=A0A438FGP4_VITVI|nr:Transposon Ty3-I Gag-Pol polyprotein [Vitis vinifera]